MRTLLVLLLILIFLIPVGIPLLLAEWIVGKFNPRLRDRSSLKIIQTVLCMILWLSGTKVTVLGRENIPENQPVLYVSNHRSYFDIVVGYTLAKGLCGFVAKKEMEKIPLLRAWMRRLHCLFLDRDNMRAGMKTILAAIEKIKSGISIWICPEGTRNQEEDFLPFKEGSFRIAEKAGCPVVPVAFTHTDDILERHFPWIRATAVTVEFGKPIMTSEMDRAAMKQLPAMAQEAVAAMYRKNY
ncbi:MAG: lysophospholipid acyltransferase family protein [Clostridiales bacterium]|nr:lysophospholipid acyltransferase family protein [Clostridiales bacterium]